MDNKLVAATALAGSLAMASFVWGTAQATPAPSAIHAPGNGITLVGQHGGGGGGTVAAAALGNSRLILAISTALAPPLLGLCGFEPGGVHLRGQSSTGKTTSLRVAASSHLFTHSACGTNKKLL